MLFSSVFTFTLLAGTALAQNIPAQSYSSPSSTKTSQVPQGTGQGNGQVKMTVIKVGSSDNKLTFDPNDVRVDVGSMIQFQFWPKNHSVARSSFDKPCVPIEQSTPGAVGFFSGFMPIQQTLGVFTIKVTDAKPIWFYCAQGNHCQSSMVGVINAPKNDTSKTIQTFTDLAKKAPANIVPSGNSSSSSAPFSNSTTSIPGATPPSSSPSSTSQGPIAATGKNAAANTRIGGAIAIVALGMALLA
ncbi:hypothetical protein GP486_003912 [Trichoglossum hirsutum]|uniref:Extracellular serine-rich protein n=1 Tax=Trichoglossum hirsutum TaxID=265104 RepID=A0A9P8RQ03_9PEZI|nr:hypothetical protein GP486_003912 [Trichoglossum hirsutum]